MSSFRVGFRVWVQDFLAGHVFALGSLALKKALICKKHVCH